MLHADMCLASRLTELLPDYDRKLSSGMGRRGTYAAHHPMLVAATLL